MAYAEYEDVTRICSGADGYSRNHVEGLLEAASEILEGEFRHARKNIYDADMDDLRNCTAQMVADVLQVGVGFDYSENITYDYAGNKAMKPSASWRRILGIPWRVQKIGAMGL